MGISDKWNFFFCLRLFPLVQGPLHVLHIKWRSSRLFFRSRSILTFFSHTFFCQLLFDNWWHCYGFSTALHVSYMTFQNNAINIVMRGLLFFCCFFCLFRSWLMANWSLHKLHHHITALGRVYPPHVASQMMTKYYIYILYLSTLDMYCLLLPGVPNQKWNGSNYANPLSDLIFQLGFLDKIVNAPLFFGGFSPCKKGRKDFFCVRPPRFDGTRRMTGEQSG